MLACAKVQYANEFIASQDDNERQGKCNLKFYHFSIHLVLPEPYRSRSDIGPDPSRYRHVKNVIFFTP